jgi:hypothetical protein
MDKYILSPASVAELQTRFTYHPPHGNQVARMQKIRDTAFLFAEIVSELAPPSDELDMAIRHIESAVFWANAAIARRESKPECPQSPAMTGDENRR